MEKINPKEFYSSVAFDEWSEKKTLNPDEKYIIEKYLEKGLKTLEAGTAGGRILLEMQKMGFTSLYGYDFVPEFIERAKQKDPSRSIAFEVQDATDLKYPDSSFDQILYLQQILSTIDNEPGRRRAIEEAYRILKVGGTALFSFISFETKTRGIMYSLYLIYLSLVRKLLGSDRSVQYFPYDTQDGKFNWSAILLGSGPYLYRYKLREACQIFNEVGFQVVALGSREQILQGIMCNSLEEMSDLSIKGAIYFVCKK
ncbi:MAG: class I SAM-dependent methyltransferase [Oscillatoriaceae cyanobacterium Prado104]|nr:class I SAM-dependent methyltransferase [Oscillatoriaceae cyanobacterium Prado104]